MLAPVVLVDVEDADEDVVELIPGSVETITPSPFRTIPLFSLQQFGSLSQQKLPSWHCTARGRKPVVVSE